MTPSLHPRIRVGVGAAVVLVVVALGCAVLFSAFADRGSSSIVAPPTAPSAGPTAPESRVFVHILGAVKAPGLYELRDGDRVVDAVAAAGGFGAHADQSSVNLARILDDGEQIVVPVVGAASTTAPGASAPGTSAAGGKINLNTATEADLETLPRIGPALAQRILDYRAANGRFSSVDDLTNVAGIGEKTFDGLKDRVTT